MGWEGAKQGASFANRTPVITQRQRPSGSKASFDTFGLQKKLERAIADAGFTQPRPIQAKTIPQALEGRDVLGLAQTGTGKTAAFALPILDLLATTKGQNPRALILAPTRELALQIHKEIELLAKYTNVRAITVFGGVGAAPQIRNLARRPDIVVACPGRLLDLMQSGHAKLGGVEVLVLDEADHMLDMGFLPDIRRILAKLPPKRQNLLFSATMSKDIRALADKVLHKPHVVELAIAAPAETIEHVLYPVSLPAKTELLRELLAADDFRSAIVFLRTKHRARKLARDLEREGHRAIALQGNMSQPQRTRAMQGFRDGAYDVLVATDIAARGIDVAGVSHVINYDVPDTPDAYTHRIGRTGRAEMSGKAYTFVTSDDSDSIRAIERKLGMQIPRVKRRAAGAAGGKQAAREGERPLRHRSAIPKRGTRDGGPREQRVGGSRPEQAGRNGSRGRGGSGQSSQPDAGRGGRNQESSGAAFGAGVGEARGAAGRPARSDDRSSSQASSSGGRGGRASGGPGTGGARRRSGGGAGGNGAGGRRRRR